MTNCSFCNKETTNPKFCSRSCAAKHNNRAFPKRKLDRKCKLCENTVKSYKHRLCTNHHDEHMKFSKLRTSNTTLEEYWSRESLKNLHRSSRNVHIRTLARYWFKHLLDKPCYNCKYDKHVELCHIKSISSFPPEATLGEVNSPSNVIQLCPNCHWEFDNKLLVLEFPDQLESQ